MLLAILNRFDRMPRGGWTKAKDVFCDRFGSDVGIQELKNRAQKALTTSSGRQCTNREFKLEATKRRKTVLTLFEENTLYEAKIHLEAFNVFKEKLATLKNQNVEEVERTRKISSLKVDLLRFDAVIKSVEPHVEIARILHAAQICYQELTRKEIKPSVWKESILKKISLLEDKVKLLRRIREFGALKEEEKRETKKCVRELNLKVCLQHDVSEAIATLSEKAAIYSKKLVVSQQRRDYRHQNQSFELYRSNFYRQLGGTRITEHEVKNEDSRSFWSTMWNKNEEAEECNTLGEYLLNYLPDAEEQITFPSYAEFQDKIKYLPNWKAEGCDGIYNYFIKKCCALHPFLYECIKEICINGKTPSSWFYKGLTYLIPKGKPTRGSDFRPITCMSNLYKLTTKCTTKVMQLIVERRGFIGGKPTGNSKIGPRS